MSQRQIGLFSIMAKSSRFVHVLLLSLLAGCNPDTPSGILSPESFRPVLKEILIAESGVEALSLNYQEKKLAREQRYQLIFKSHDLSPVTFMQNFEYYRTHPEIMDSMYAGILDELNEDLMQQRVFPVANPNLKTPNRP
jgi:hypothetical protein